jgi:hypothetical protein
MRTTEIATNLSLALPNFGLVDELELGNTRQIPGDHFVTFIEPKYAEVFQDGIRPLMYGILNRQAHDKLKEPSFSLIETMARIDGNGQVGTIFAPAMNRLKIDLGATEHTRMEAIHGFHISIVNSTNRALEALRSKYRLPEVPMVDPARHLTQE